MRTGETIVDEIVEMYDQITLRAYEIFLERGGICTLDLEDWFNGRTGADLQAETSASGKKVFRTIEFPRRIDMSRAEAKYENGRLVLTA